jgi:hypothetical protein
MGPQVAELSGLERFRAVSMAAIGHAAELHTSWQQRPDSAIAAGAMAAARGTLKDHLQRVKRELGGSRAAWNGRVDGAGEKAGSGGSLIIVMHGTHRAASVAGPLIGWGRSSARPRVSVWLAVVGSLLMTAACSSSASEADCEKLRDKIIDLEFAAMGAKAQTAEAREQITKQKRETSEGVAARFKDSCLKNTPKALVECATTATSLEAIKQCDEQK